MRKPHRRWPVPRALERGIVLVNRLRGAAVQSPDAGALQALDDSCSRALLDWWCSVNLRMPALPAPPCSTLSDGAALAVGAMCGIVMETRYRENGPHEGVASLLEFAKHGRLGELGITGALATLFVTLEKRPDLRSRVRRCLYMFVPTSGRRTRGCLAYFVDRSPAGNALGCKRSHSVRVLQYRHTTPEGQYISRRGGCKP